MRGYFGLLTNDPFTLQAVCPLVDVLLGLPGCPISPELFTLQTDRPSLDTVF